MIRRRRKTDPVTPDLREALLARDMGCVLAFLQEGHVCRNQWGDVIDWRDRDGLTVEHVKSQLQMGRRAPSDLAHTVILCAGANIGVPSKEQRNLIRAYLEGRPVIG